MIRLFSLLFLSLSIWPVAAPAQAKPQTAAQTRQVEKAEPQSPVAQQLARSKSAATDKQRDCGCEAKLPSGALARINGVEVSLKDVDENIEDALEELRNRVIEARGREVNLQINTLLLEAEAEKRKVSAQRVFEEEVTSRIKEPTEDEARTFYEENKSRILDGDSRPQFADVKSELIDYLREARQKELSDKLAARLRAAYDVKVLIGDPDPPEKDADRSRVFASVNGRQITSGDVEDALRPLILDVQEQIYELRKQQLDLKISAQLMDQEAEKRKITRKDLIDSEVLPNIKTVTEEDALSFFEQNKERLKGEFSELKSRIVSHLQRIETRKRAADFADQLRQTASVQVFLEVPSSLAK